MSLKKSIILLFIVLIYSVQAVSASENCEQLSNNESGVLCNLNIQEDNFDAVVKVMFASDVTIKYSNILVWGKDIEQSSIHNYINAMMVTINKQHSFIPSSMFAGLSEVTNINLSLNEYLIINISGGSGTEKYVAMLYFDKLGNSVKREVYVKLFPEVKEIITYSWHTENYL